MNPETLLSGLLARDDNAWSDFFFNVTAARQLSAVITTDQAQAVVSAAVEWGAPGYTTSRASRRLYDSCGQSFVSARPRNYLSC